MLVLSRRRGETILVGDDIRVTITDIRNGQVKIGIDAPKHINVVRLELVERAVQRVREKRSEDDG